MKINWNFQREKGLRKIPSWGGGGPHIVIEMLESKKWRQVRLCEKYYTGHKIKNTSLYTCNYN